MKSSARYDRWNSALLQRFFSPRQTGDPVYLAVDEDELNQIGRDLPEVAGSAAHDLQLAVRDLLRRNGSLGKVATLAQRWRSEREAPPYVALLALCVLAASRMAADPSNDVHANDYYSRVNPLFGRAPEEAAPPGFEQLRALWEDLRTWLDADLAGARGSSTVRGHPHFIHIGYPISQCVLRAVDRARLPYFFRFAGFEPREEVSGGRLLTLFRSWARPGCGLSVTGLRTAASRQLELQTQLEYMLSAELWAWDGELRDASGRRRAEVSLFAERAAGGRRVTLSLYARRPEGFPDEFSGADNGKTAGLQAGNPGWYRRMAREVTATQLATQFSLTQGAYSLEFLPERIIPLREAFEPSSGWLEARQVTPFEPHMVLVHASLRDAVQAFARDHAEPGWEFRTPAGCPAGWVVVDKLRVRDAPASAPPALVRLAPRMVSSLSLQGGLRLGPGLYLERGEPDLEVTFDPGQDATVELDGRSQEFGTSLVKLPLRTQRLEPGIHTVQAGGQRRSFETVPGFGVSRPDHAGEMAIILERHSTYMPRHSEASPVSGGPPQGTVHVAGAWIDAAPEDLPLVPPRPVVLRRKFLRWQLLGPEVGDFYNGGATPPRPAFFRKLPGSPLCQFFEDYPEFLPEIVLYTGETGILARPLTEEPVMPTWPDRTSPAEALPWARVVVLAENRGVDLHVRLQPVWSAYVAMARAILESR